MRRDLLLPLALLVGGPVLADDRQVCAAESGPRAVEACSRAIASGSYAGLELAKLHTNRGVERKRLGQFAEALADYADALRLNPTDPFAHNNSANARRDVGDLEGALAAYTEALRLDPGYTAAYINRGLLHERMGRPRRRAPILPKRCGARRSTPTAEAGRKSRASASRRYPVVRLC